MIARILIYLTFVSDAIAQHPSAASQHLPGAGPNRQHYTAAQQQSAASDRRSNVQNPLAVAPAHSTPSRKYPPAAQHQASATQQRPITINQSPDATQEQPSVVLKSQSPLPPLDAPPVRERINFDFGWRHFLGPIVELCAVVPPSSAAQHNVGVAAQHNCSDKTPTAAASSFDDSGWVLVDAPHDMLLAQTVDKSNQASQGFLPRTEGWYRKRFALPAAWERDRAVWFCSEGIFHLATAWLNGQPLGARHKSGYNGFCLRLDNVTGVLWGSYNATPGDTTASTRLDGAGDSGGHVDPIENVLTIHVDARYGTNWWYQGGGLLRHQYLVSASRHAHLAPDGSDVFAFGTHVAGIRRATKGRGLVARTASLKVSASVTSGERVDSARARSWVADPEDPEALPTHRVQVRFTLSYSHHTRSGAEATVIKATATAATAAPQPGGTVTVQTVLPVENVSLWSVYRPRLYKLGVEVFLGAEDEPVDALNVSTIGFRHVEFDASRGLRLNGEHVKIRGFCDHSTFGGVGAAVPDRVQLYRAQVLRSVGGNAWRMAHNPPAPARLDYTDALGMMVLDENRDLGPDRQEGPPSERESGEELVAGMASMVAQDRNHASVLAWSICNEVGCDDEAWTKAFRDITYLLDGSRPVTQNHVGTELSTRHLDVQGFSHKGGDWFDSFHERFPAKPTLATECCSCLSQRGVDQDACPEPRPEFCTDDCHHDCSGKYPDGVESSGDFYHNEISNCTASQILESDGRGYVAGSFVWSGFDYLGESRGWPQTVKCRGAVADVAGFFKESSHFLRTWWLANVAHADAGRPAIASRTRYVIFIPESWVPLGRHGVIGPVRNPRTIHIYSNAPKVGLFRNGLLLANRSTQHFGSVEYEDVRLRTSRVLTVARLLATFQQAYSAQYTMTKEARVGLWNENGNGTERTG
eukprot:gene347-634_t